MLNLKNKGKALFFLLFCLTAFLGGGLNGFLGTGGGIIFVLGLSLLTNNEKKDNYITTLIAIIPISIVGSFAYFSQGSVDFSLLKDAYLPALLGGVAGAFLVDKINVKLLSLLFSGLVIYSGVTMLVR